MYMECLYNMILVDVSYVFKNRDFVEQCLCSLRITKLEGGGLHCYLNRNKLLINIINLLFTLDLHYQEMRIGYQ
jgi:hypothetical protein